MIVFAGVACLLAFVGVYGMFWCVVSQRAREIGVRVALGATPGNILRLVLLSSVRLSAIGAMIGIACAAAATRVLRTLLYNVSPTDPLAFGAATVLLFAAALAASAIPARRASRVDPSAVLRSE